MIDRYSWAPMAALWTDEARLRSWLEVELAACDAMALEGIISKNVASQLRRAAKRIDLKKFSRRAAKLEASLHHDVIAFLSALEEAIGPLARSVHLGLTSSDVVDTAFALRLVEACDLILERIDVLLDALWSQAERHKATPMIGRSHGIHAEPTSFGLVLLTYCVEFSRQRERLVRVREGVAVGKLSGAVGTFAHLPVRLEERALKVLGLKSEPAAGQVVLRDRHADLFNVIALVGASVERLAVEIRHLARTEVAEVSEPFGRRQRGSSAMPHKKNPILSENVTGLARLLRGYSHSAMENVALWHQRDISHSSVERVIAPDAFGLLGFMLVRMTHVVAHMSVNHERMQSNLDQTGGLWASQTLLLGLVRAGVARQEAYGWIQRNALRAQERGEDFGTLVAADVDISKRLGTREIRSAFSVASHLKNADRLFRRAARVTGRKTPRA